MDFRPDIVISESFQFLLVAACFLQSLLYKVMPIRLQRWLPWAAGAGVVVSLLCLGHRGSMFHGTYQVDQLSQFFKVAVAAGFFFASLNATRQPTLPQDKRHDYFLFMALSAWGLMIMSSAVELITIYLALELSSYSLYAVLPLRSKDRQAAEAGIKYILFGAVATALALYGFSYILATQHTSFLGTLSIHTWSWADSPLAVVGLTLFMGGMLYKLALFPFHFWAPDVYQGASNETAAFVATLPKLGAAVVLIRLGALLTPDLEITHFLAVLAAVSMTWGNLGALVQKDVKRILGYSTVAHAGYFMVGLVPGTAEGLAAAGFYALVYVVMNLTCFWVLSRVAADGRNLNLDDLNGLHKRSPALALALAAGAFALVGLPPTGGFMGKLFLFTAAWGHGYDWLVIVAALNAAVSIYYYLGLVRHAYTQDDPPRPPAIQPEPRFSAIWGVVLTAILLILGIVPGPVFNLALQAGRSLMP
jgi:proton-translocating NADH-quinone oxidoreductase chain N